MWKAILAGTSALVIAGSSLVYAQQREGRSDARRGPPNIEDMRAFAEARLAALKAGLMLTPEQERNWPAFEQAARELAKQRLERMNAFASARRDRQPRSTDPIERMRRRADMMSETGAALKKFADFMDPLYKSLDDSQKRRFAMFNRFGVRDGGRDGREFRGREFRGRDDERELREREGRREFRGRDADREYRGRSDEREFRGRDGGREFRGREFGRREFGNREFRGRGYDEREFRGRDDEREYRGREDGRRGTDRGPRRSEFDGSERDRRGDRGGFDRGRQGDSTGRDRGRDNERDARPERGPREGEGGEQRL
jgi:zinc resistance-associated protein